MKKKFPKSKGFFVVQKSLPQTQSVLYKNIAKIEKSGKKLPRELLAAKRKMEKAPKEQVGAAVLLFQSKVIADSPTLDGDLRKFLVFIKNLEKAGKKLNSAKILKATQEGFKAEKLRTVYIYRDANLHMRVGMGLKKKTPHGILSISANKKQFGCFLIGKYVDHKALLKQLAQAIDLLKKGPIYVT